MLRPDEDIPDCLETLRELSRTAPDSLLARLFDHIAQLQEKIDKAPTEADILDQCRDSYWSGFEDGRERP